MPVLWDTKNITIVNNESSEIIRMLNSEFNDFSATDDQRKLDLYPEDLAQKIEEVNTWVYSWVQKSHTSFHVEKIKIYVQGIQKKFKTVWWIFVFLQ